MKTPFQRILGINLGIMLALAVALRLLNRGRESDMGFVIMMALVLGVHLFVLLLAALFSKSSENTRAYWLSLLLVGLIGFGACLAGAAIRM
ncbi:hypothetical protein [Hymenobacter ruricola]|uniref:Uncharacterized protein n=1 Tax=Hymenobacter ruricola TaxID=2791023 RepID=A0ABS0I2A0_9BACT|nr:hypothetical protein [Hymenobacter ruricola]MBF9221070.1 hypothetical protein [Hymenobacter ruricola]